MWSGFSQRGIGCGKEINQVSHSAQQFGSVHSGIDWTPKSHTMSAKRTIYMPTYPILSSFFFRILGWEDYISYSNKKNLSASLEFGSPN